MENRERDRLQMYMQVSAFLQTRAEDLESVVHVGEVRTAFEGVLSELIALGSETDLRRSLGGEEKLRKRAEMSRLTLAMAKRLSAYALFAEDAVLAGEVRVTLWELGRLRQVAVRNRAMAVYRSAVAFADRAGSFGVSGEATGALLEAIAAYDEAFSTTRLQWNARSMRTAETKRLMGLCEGLLLKLDALLELTAFDNLPLYSAYRRCRKVVRTGHRRLCVQGLVVDGVSGAGVAGARLVFEGEQGAVFERVSAKGGGFQVKQANDGVYRVRVQKTGYVPAVVQVVVGKDAARLVVSLERLSEL